MKTIAALLLAVLVPALALAKPLKYEKVEGTLVAADVQAGTFTMKLDDGTQFVTRAEGLATRTIAHTKPNARILATFRNNAKGDHVAAVQIKVLPGGRPAAPTPTSPPAPSGEPAPPPASSSIQDGSPAPAKDPAPSSSEPSK